MPTIVDDAICIRHWDFSETSQTVSMFARAHGLIRGIAKGSRRERGRFCGGIDLLTRGQLGASIKPGRELSILTEWDLRETLRTLRTDLAANRAAFYMADLVGRLLAEPDPHERVYDAMVEAMRGLDAGDAVDRVLLRFQWILIVDTGYQPRLDRAAGGGATILFSPAAGGVIARETDARHGPVWKVRAATIDLLQRLADEPESEPAEPTDPEVTSRAARLLGSYLREVIGAELPTMKALWGS